MARVHGPQHLSQRIGSVCVRAEDDRCLLDDQLCGSLGVNLPALADGGCGRDSLNQDYQDLRSDAERWERYLGERSEWDALA